MQRLYKPNVVLADIRRHHSSEDVNEIGQFRMADVVCAEKLEKFVEDVK